MIIFHDLVFEGSLPYVPTGYGMVFTSANLSLLLGQVDMLHVSGYASQVSGTAPSLFISFASSADGHIWNNEPAVTGGALSTSGETVFCGVSQNSASLPVAPYRKLMIGVSGTSAILVGRLKIWITGRDTSKRAQALVASA